MLNPNPTFAKPSIHRAKATAQQLYHQAEQASERYNKAADQLKAARQRLSALQSDLDRQQAKVDQVRTQVASSVVSQYQGQALSTTTQAFLSKNPDAFLNQLATVSQFNDQRSQMMADFAVQEKQLELRKQAAKRELAQIAKTKKQLAAEKATIHKKAAAAKALLDRLQAEAAARTATVSRSASRPPLTTAPVSGSAAAVVAYAEAQLGDAYVYGATGPDAWDCSGLTMGAWAQAGVSLPHNAAAQMSYGTPVSESELQPGDLVFYYQPVSHVGIYIGNGQIVNAENPSVGVVTAPVNSMPYSGAVRIR
jgi:cell wall-associated NlpC family hydrolase